MKHTNRAHGFTLIELLVVIAIIAILAAILFPVFAQAREKARAIACISNFKQVGLAVEQYKTDYDGHWPLWWNGDENHIGDANFGRFWAGAIMPYIKNVQVRKCPSDPFPIPPDPEVGDHLNGPVQSMTSNRNINFDETKSIPGTWIHPSMSDAEIQEPARVIAVHECVGCDEGRTTPIQDSYTGWWGGDEMKYGDTHHNKGGSFIFFDGHAKWLRPNSVEPCPPNDGWGGGPLDPYGVLTANPNHVSGLAFPNGKNLPATFCTQ